MYISAYLLGSVVTLHLDLDFNLKLIAGFVILAGLILHPPGSSGVVVPLLLSTGMVAVLCTTGVVVALHTTGMVLAGVEA